MLQNETFENFFAKYAKEAEGREGVQKIVEKSPISRRDAFVDDP